MAAGTLVSSGSSLNMPTGSGSERLCRASIHALNNDTQTILTGVAGHIYTILSMTFCDQQGASGTIRIQIETASGGDVRIMSDGGGGSTSVAAEGTFVFNDKLVLEEDDLLKVFNSCTNGDWYISYIDQNWT